VSGKKKASSVHDGIFQEDFFCVDGTDFYSSPKLLQHASRETQKNKIISVGINLLDEP
jgi:hypothetical protein